MLVVTDTAKALELGKWNGFLTVWRMARRVQQIIVGVCIFVVDAGGEAIVTDRDSKVEEID